MKSKFIYIFYFLCCLIFQAKSASKETTTFYKNSDPFNFHNFGSKQYKNIVQSQIISPAGGESWSAESIHPITWVNASNLDTVNLEYSVDGGFSWSLMIDYSTNLPIQSLVVMPDIQNQVLWKVPSLISNNALIRVINQNNLVIIISSAFKIERSRSLNCSQWDTISLNAQFAPRDGAGALTFNGKMWLLGGWNPNDLISFPQITNSEVWSSNDGINWTLENAQAPWESRHVSGYVVYDNKMWIVGGDCNQGHYQPDVWNTSDGVNWQQVNDSTEWGLRVLNNTLVFNNKIWTMGGQTIPQMAAAADTFYNDVWNSLDGITWNKVTDSANWTPRGMIGGNAVMNGKMWILGGGTYDTPNQPYRNFYNDVWSSDDGINWTCVNNNTPWIGRQYHDVAVYNNRLWVLEGFDNQYVNRNDVWYSDDGINWYEIKNTPWPERHAASIFVHNNALWVVTGNNMTSDVWRLQCYPEISTKIINNMIEETIEVFPNPATNLVNVIVHSSDKAYNITITDCKGQQLINQYSDKSETSLNLSSLANGVYILQVKGDLVNKTVKLIKQ